MANIKITELNGITKKASDDVLPIVDVSANETKKIAVEDLLDKNVELIAVTDTEPAECSYGDKYYNTEDNLIYTAIANDTWGEVGEEPIEGIFYVVFGEQSSYAYDGTTLISVGGGTEDIIISPNEPTSDDWKIWIDSNEVINSGSEIIDEYSESTKVGYSANYVNNITNNDYVDISSEITSINQPADLSVYRANYKKNSNINVLDMVLRSDTGFSSGGAAAYILTLPEKYRPTQEIITTCRLTADYSYPTWDGVNSGSTIGFLKIETSGTMYIRFPAVSGATMKTAQIHIVY